MAGSWKKSFALIYTGQAFSLLSSSAVQFSIIWWITVDTGSAIALTVASIIGLLPQVVIGPFAGVWIDRYSRKAIMMLADGVTAFSSILLGLAFLLGHPPFAFVCGVLFVRALGDTFQKPALLSAIPQLVPPEALTKVGGLGQMVNSACNMAGPMLGALLMSVATMPFVMAVDLLGAALAILALSGVRIGLPCASGKKRMKVLSEMRQGFQAVRAEPGLLRISIPVFLTSFVFMPLGNLLPLMVREYFSGTAWHNGIAKTLFSTGMLLSALLIGITGVGKRKFLMISSASFMLGICSLAAGLLPPNAFPVFCVLVFVMGMTGMWSNIPYVAYIQGSVGKENLGKVMSFATSAMSAGIPLGMLIAGPVAEALGVGGWMIFAGGGMALVGILSYPATRKLEVPAKGSPK